MKNIYQPSQAVNYARLAGALGVQLASALAVLNHLSGESGWAKEQAKTIEALFKEIEEGKFIEHESGAPPQKAPF